MELWFGWLAWRTDSIWPGVICHAATNALALLLSRVNVTEAVLQPVTIVPLVVCVACLIAITRFMPLSVQAQ